MNRKVHGFILAAALFFAAPALAEQPPIAPAAEEPKKEAPALTPQQQKIADLIAQLAADDFTKRDAASEELQKIGSDALPALREALKNDDPSIRSYAEYLVPKIEGKRPGQRQQLGGVKWEVPAGNRRVVGGNVVFNRDGHLQINVGARDGFRRTNIKEGGRDIQIEEGPDGIKMSVSENGQKKEYEAKNIEQLRKDAPDAAAIYDRFSARGEILGQPNLFRLNGEALDLRVRDQMLRAQKLHDRVMAEQQVRLRDLLDLDDNVVFERPIRAEDELERVHQKLKADTEVLQRKLAEVEAMHQRLLEQTKAAQKRLADLEREQNKPDVPK